MAVGSFEPTFHLSESRRRVVCMPLQRGSLKRGFFERFHLLTQVHRPPHTAKRGLSTSHRTCRVIAGRDPHAALTERTSRVLPIYGYVVERRRHHRRRWRRVRRVAVEPQAHRRRHHRPRGRAGRAPDQGRRARRRNPQEGNPPRRQGKSPRARSRMPSGRRTRNVSRPRRSSRRSPAATRRSPNSRPRSSAIEKDLARRDGALADREKTAAAAAAKYERARRRQQHELERVASLTADEAKELLIKQIEGDARHDAANLLKRLDAEARETAVDRAKQYITEAIQRSAAEHAIETTVSVVDLPSDDLEGPHHRARGTQHPRARARHGRRSHRRRHAGRDHPLRLRSRTAARSRSRPSSV